MAPAAGGDLALTGSWVWGDRVLGWISAWSLRWQGRIYRWRIGGVNFNEAFRIRMPAQVPSGHGQP